MRLLRKWINKPTKLHIGNQEYSGQVVVVAYHHPDSIRGGSHTGYGFRTDDNQVIFITSRRGKLGYRVSPSDNDGPKPSELEMSAKQPWFVKDYTLIK